MIYLFKGILSFVEDRWSIGFIEEPLSDIIDGKPYTIKYVTGIPKDRWFADPFILDYNDNSIELLVEEWLYATNKGRITRVVIDRSSLQLSESHVILELPTHLSYPFILRKEEKIYVLPENSASGLWKLYEYDRAEDALKEVRILMDKPLTDAVITELFGDEFVFSTYQPTACGSVLSVYRKENELYQEIDFNSRIARGAGDWFKIGNKVYRPAQDCNGGYGKAVIIQEVERDFEGLFSFKNVRRITSTHKRFNVGCHTLNNYNGLTVVDVRGYRRRIISTFIVSIKNMIKRLIWRS